MRKSFIRILLAIDYRNIKDAMKVWCGTNFSNFKQKIESWMDDITFNQEVGREWIGSGRRLVRGKYIVNTSKFIPSWQRGMTTCQYKCKKRGLKVTSRIKKLCKSGFLDMMMWRFVNVLKSIGDDRTISWKFSDCWSRKFL